MVPGKGVEGACGDPASAQLLRRDAQEAADVRAYTATAILEKAWRMCLRTPSIRTRVLGGKRGATMPVVFPHQLSRWSAVTAYLAGSQRRSLTPDQDEDTRTCEELTNHGHRKEASVQYARD